MLYISGLEGMFVCVTDSGSGKKWRVPVEDLDDSVLGYMDSGVAYPVTEQLLGFMGYVEDIRLTQPVEEYILVSNYGIGRTSRHNILVELDGTDSVCSVIDILLCASYDEKFQKVLSAGEITVAFGSDDFLSIRLCEEYMREVAKLIVGYREGAEFQRRLDVDRLIGVGVQRDWFEAYMNVPA